MTRLRSFAAFLVILSVGCVKIDPEELAIQAEDALSKGLYDEGMEKAKIVLDLQPGNVKFRDKVAMYQYALQQYADAVPQFEQLIQLKSEAAGFKPGQEQPGEDAIKIKEVAKKEKIDESYFYLALCQMKLQQFASAKSNFVNALAVNPDWKVAAFVVDCINAFDDGTLTPQCYAHLDEAIDNFIQPEDPRILPYYDKVLADCPTFKEALENKGICLMNARKFDESLEAFQVMLQTYPEDSEAHRSIGFLLARKGSLRQAIPHYKKALTYDPNNADAKYQLGEVYQKWKDPRMAKQYFLAYLEQEPEGYYAKATREHLAELGVKGYSK